VYLRAVGDLTVPDIARALGKPESAVKALLRRATATLVRRMREEVDGG
jgi:DNA-directed RNA polymerase specialized sigma24 family protein